MEELKKSNRDWATFLFLSGYDVDVLNPKKTPKSNTSTPKKDKEPIAKAGVEPEEDVQRIVEPMEVEIEKLQETVAPKPTPTRNKLKYDTRAHRIITRS